MSDGGSQLCNPFSTGGGGVFFESQVQACYAALMLTDGFAPGLERWPIKNIRLQARIAGYYTDDLVVLVESPDGTRHQRMLGQIKHSIAITKGDKTFEGVIRAAWNDFNNSRLFSRDGDAIALITGPLSKTDISDTREMLEWARTSDGVDDFVMKVNSTNFSNETKRQKLDAFQVQLKRANNGTAIPNNDVFRFLRCFYLLGYDLDFRPGVVASLLDSLISPSSHYGAQSLWDQIVGEVQHVNMTAGTLDKETLQARLGDSFQPLHIETIPPELLARPSEPSEEVLAVFSGDWNRYTYASELVIADLVGSWDENCEGDIGTICRLAGSDYRTWISGIREVLQEADSPVTLKNGIWSVPKRYDLWQALGGRIFDANLASMAEVVVTVLAERDPQFDLSSDKRFAASLYRKELTHSSQLRKGLAETLALLGSHPETLTSCTTGRAEGTAKLVVRDILSEAGWERWASLNDVLPLLAEAAPLVFLDEVDEALQMPSCPFDGVFVQEGEDSLTGRNYMTGLLWALEGLAWNENFFSRVISILGELAHRDPGGTGANRPANSLVTILLPWLPQTMAPVEQRRVAIEVLCRNQPEVAWNLLLELLPKTYQVSMRSYHPIWQTEWIRADRQESVAPQEYWTAVSSYADMAASMAKDNLQRLMQLLDHWDSLSPKALDEVLAHVASDSTQSLPEEQRTELWNRLMQLIDNNERAEQSQGAMGPEMLDKVKAVAERIAPASPFYRYQRLFSSNSIDLFDRKGSYEEQEQRLERHRQEGINEIYQTNGREGLLEFVHAIESPLQAGVSCGMVANDVLDVEFLPSLLDLNDPALQQFINGFIMSRYNRSGQKWVNTIDVGSWSVGEKAQFLAYLPFAPETWGLATLWLQDDKIQYWMKTPVLPYGTKSDFSEAVGDLLEAGRPVSAARCLKQMVSKKRETDSRQIIRTLEAITKSSEKLYYSDADVIAGLVEALRQDPTMNRDHIATLEWTFMLLLDGTRSVRHEALDRELAGSPEFFCQVIRLVFHSEKEKDVQRSLSEQQRRIAERAYDLLSEWKAPPGLHEDGTFHGEDLNSWLEGVKSRCTESGHLEVALDIAGQVLFYAPPDPDGLWIDASVAQVLDRNDKVAKYLRSGFYSAAINSQGAHWVDPSGKDELDLAEKYHQKANDLNMHGFSRFAATLQDIAEHHNREAKEVTDRFGKLDDE